MDMILKNKIGVNIVQKIFPLELRFSSLCLKETKSRPENRVGFCELFSAVGNAFLGILYIEKGAGIIPRPWGMDLLNRCQIRTASSCR